MKALMDNIDTTTFLGWLFGIIGSLIMTIFHVSVFSRIKKVESDSDAQEKKLAAIELLVAGNYVKREDLTMAIQNIERTQTAMFKKLDAISDKLDTKADKHACEIFHSKDK